MSVTETDRSQPTRAAAVAAAVAEIRTIERERGVSRESLGDIKRVLIGLAARRELFGLDDFPAAAAADGRNSCLYRISEDDDHRFALYVNVSDGEYSTPAHNHTTWAVIVGVEGEEHNRFYRRAEQGVEQTGEATVSAGNGVTFLPDELHSIHMSGDAPVLNFHMYGLALEQLHEREYYSERERSWKIFPAQRDIREAR